MKQQLFISPFFRLATAFVQHGVHARRSDENHSKAILLDPHTAVNAPRISGLAKTTEELASNWNMLILLRDNGPHLSLGKVK